MLSVSIGSIRTRFHILDGPMPIRFVKSLKGEAPADTNVAPIDKIVITCAALVNMEKSIVYNEQEK